MGGVARVDSGKAEGQYDGASSSLIILTSAESTYL